MHKISKKRQTKEANPSLLTNAPAARANITGAELARSRPLADTLERRGESRLLTNLRARLRILNPFSPQAIVVEILDVSRRGLGVRGPWRLPVETAVQIICGQSIILGEVRYCFPLGDGMHHAGILIEECIYGPAATIPPAIKKPAQ